MEYQTIGDMLKARDAIKQELNDQAAESAGISRPFSYRARTKNQMMTLIGSQKMSAVR